MTEHEQAAIKLQTIEEAQSVKSNLTCLLLKLDRMASDLSASGSSIVHIASELKRGERSYQALNAYPSHAEISETIEAIKSARKRLAEIQTTLRDLGLGSILS